MDLVGGQYYNFNMHLLSSIGLWPYDSKTHRRIRNVICWSLLHTAFVFQIASVTDTQYTAYMFFKNISYISASLGFIVKYDAYYLHLGDLKHLLEQVRTDWRLADCKEELEILHKYNRQGKLHARYFSLMLYMATFATIIAPFSSVLLNVVAPLNQTRELQIPIPLNLIIFDHRKHFYLITVFVDITILIGGITFVATESTIIMFLQHVCALFTITSLCDYAQRVFGSSYLLLLVLGMFCLIINLYRLSQTIVHVLQLDELLTSSLYSIGILIYMFYFNYMMQQWIDHSNTLFTNTYDIEWYNLPACVQKLLLFFMLKAMKLYIFNCFGFFNSSIEGFSKIARMSVSYFMVLYSYQQS